MGRILEEVKGDTGREGGERMSKTKEERIGKAWEEYDKKCKPFWEEYRKKCKPLREECDKKCEEILAEDEN